MKLNFIKAQRWSVDETLFPTHFLIRICTGLVLTLTEYRVLFTIITYCSGSCTTIIYCYWLCMPITFGLTAMHNHLVSLRAGWSGGASLIICRRANRGRKSLSAENRWSWQRTLWITCMFKGKSKNSLCQMIFPTTVIIPQLLITG